MPLDTIGRQYADRLYQESHEEILKSQRTELFEVNQDFATRNMTMSGPYFTAQVQVYLRNAERLAQARVDSLLRAYEKSEIILRDLDFQELVKWHSSANTKGEISVRRCPIELDNHSRIKLLPDFEMPLLDRS